MKILVSTGALIGLANKRNYHLLKDIVPSLDCDGLEFMMYRCWYDQVDNVIQCLNELNIDIPVMHFEKSIGEDIVKEGIDKVVDR